MHGDGEGGMPGTIGWEQLLGNWMVCGSRLFIIMKLESKSPDQLMEPLHGVLGHNE